MRIQGECGRESARVRIIPVCEDDLKDMWVWEAYRQDADELTARAEGKKPALRVLREDE